MKMIPRINKFGQRAAFGLIFRQMMENDEKLVICSADTSTSGGLDRCKKDFPNRVIEVGIGEQNLVGIACGLSVEGWTSFAATFAPFMTLRCLEQLKVLGAYNRIPIKIVGYASGLALIDLGYTHCGIEDIAVIRAIGDFDIVAPSDCVSLSKLLPQVATSSASTYVRLTGGSPSVEIYEADGSFRGSSFSHSVGNFNHLIHGHDVLVIANGIGVYNSLVAIDELSPYHPNRVGLIDVYHFSNKVIDDLRTAITQSGRLLIVEEHRRVGGLAEFITSKCMPINDFKPYKHACIRDGFAHAIDHQTALEENDLSAASLKKLILELLEDDEVN